MSEEKEIPNRRAFDNWKVVGPLPRTLAFLIDTSITGLVLYLGMLAFQFSELKTQQFVFLWILASWTWEGLWLTLTGTTPGKRLLGISIYSPRMDGIPHPMQVCQRILTFWISVVLLFSGLTPIIFRRDRRGWHDLISETLTVGRKKELPSAFAQSLGHAVLLAQSLVVFSIFGALLLASGTGAVFNYQASTETSCDNRNLIFDHKSEVLFALTVSPSWQSCKYQLLTSLDDLSDSQLGRMISLASEYHTLWTIPMAARASYYQNNIQAKEDALCAEHKSLEEVCKTARSLASISAGLEIETPGWIGKYLTITQGLSLETDAEKRIEYLNEELQKQTHPIVVDALNDRLWHEMVAIGKNPTTYLSKYNSSAQVERTCWAPDAQNLSSCKDGDYQKALAVIQELSNGGSVQNASDQISRLEPGTVKKDFDLVIEFADALRAGDVDRMQAAEGQLSLISPLRMPASQLLK